MSREAPRFGEVFRWKSESQESLVMYVAPTNYSPPTSTINGTYVKDTWIGVSIDDGDFLLAGDVDIRLTLDYANWSEVSDD